MAITYDSGSDSYEARLLSSASAALPLKLSVVCLLKELLPLAGAISSLLLAVSAMDDSFLRRRFALMDLGRSFPKPLPSIPTGAALVIFSLGCLLVVFV